MLPIIGSSIFSLGYVIFTIFYGTLSLPLWVTPAAFRHRIILSWTHLIIFWARMCCGIRYEVQGLEHVEKLDTAAIILSKHQSTWETLFLQGLFWPASTILKIELLKMPFFGWGLRALRPIAIDRSNPREALKQVKLQSAAKLDQGINIILFPEGTRMATGERGKYARSGTDIAIASGKPVIPIAHNAGCFWPSKQFIKKPGKIVVRLGPAIYPEGKNSKEMIREVEAWIEKEMENLS
ncbi:MAG: 1-acyl-sn-glycerol-3-phosphate acyltransferase [Flavobacteriales bacterium]|jgi:1-acyl-sn-glycerol-3-phosphate acyltransferase